MKAALLIGWWMDQSKVGRFGDVFVHEAKGGIQHNANMQNSDEQE